MLTDSTFFHYKKEQSVVTGTLCTCMHIFRQNFSTGLKKKSKFSLKNKQIHQTFIF